MTTTRPSRLLYCHLRQKYTTLEIATRDESDGGEVGRREYRCLEPDRTCDDRRCRLSDWGQAHPEDAHDPWFDE
jgi:hypothetical protein